MSQESSMTYFNPLFEGDDFSRFSNAGRNPREEDETEAEETNFPKLSPIFPKPVLLSHSTQTSAKRVRSANVSAAPSEYINQVLARSPSPQSPDEYNSESGETSADGEKQPAVEGSAAQPVQAPPRILDLLRDETYELTRCPITRCYIASKDPHSTAEVHQIFGMLYNTVEEPEPEGEVYGVGAKVIGGNREIYLYKIVEIGNPIRCQHCPKLFRTVMMHKVHLKKAHANLHADLVETRIACRNCGEKFENEANLRRHASLVHAGPPMFRCEQCPATFGSKLTFVRHMRDSHNVIPESRRRYGRVTNVDGQEGNPQMLLAWKCCTCSSVVSNKGNLMRHIRITHLNRRNFMCALCHQKFGTDHNVHIHLPNCRGAPSNAEN